MSALSAASSISDQLTGSSRLSVGGLASGLDTEKLLEGLLAINQRRIEQLQGRQTRVQQQQAAHKGIEARLVTLQTQLGQLARTYSSVFDARTATSSNDALATAVASTGAATGVHQLQINSLAKSHQILSQGFDSAASAITEGTIEIRAGAGAAQTITIDGGNNTLQGLANAINAAGAGITAAVINDGSSSTSQPYRLLLTSTKTGTANAIVITNNLASETGGSVRPIFDSSFLGAANVDAGYTGVSLPTSNRGAGVYTGASNNTYTFTVVAGGTVGADNGLQVSYVDSTGANAGVITLDAGDVDAFKNVAQGLQVKFSAGSLVAGEKFTIKGTVPQVQAATDASVTIGSGAGALTVASSTNQIDSLYPGLALNLLGADPSKTVTLTVANDAAKMKQAIGDFIGNYNDLLKFIDEQVQFEAQSGAAGVLLGDRQASAIQEAVRDAMMRPVAGLASQVNRLNVLGITATDQGRLTIDSAKLDSALAGQVSGVTLGDIRRLFTLSGVSSKSGIDFISASAKTKASNAPYQVTVTQAAEQASIIATSSLAASTVINSSNNTFTITIDGATSSTVTLTAGTYSRLALAQEVQTQINANANLGGRRVTVALNGDRLAIASNAYGVSSRVTIGNGTALTPLGLAGTETDLGADVAGYFTVNGLVETATGVGQSLTGASANANTADLQVRVSLSPTQVGSGATGDLTVTRGIASVVDGVLTNLLDPVTGRMKNIDDGYQNSIDDIQDAVARQNRFLESRRDSLLRQFVNMEKTLSQLQSLGSYLTTQLAQLNNFGSTSR